MKRIFSNLEGGSGGPPPENLKTSKAGEAISGQFHTPILPSVNEHFQMIFKKICIYVCISLVCRYQCSHLTTDIITLFRSQ